VPTFQSSCIYIFRWEVPNFYLRKLRTQLKNNVSRRRRPFDSVLIPGLFITLTFEKIHDQPWSRKDLLHNNLMKYTAASAAGHSGHRVCLQNGRSRVWIPPWYKIFRCCCKNFICIVTLCIWEKLMLEKNNLIKHLRSPFGSSLFWRIPSRYTDKLFPE
jgi:hypothetical protein